VFISRVPLGLLSLLGIFTQFFLGRCHVFNKKAALRFFDGGKSFAFWNNDFRLFGIRYHRME